MNGQLFSSSGSANDTPTPPSNNSYPASLSSQSSRDASPHGPRAGPNGANGPFQPLHRNSPYGHQISPHYPAQQQSGYQTDPKRTPWNDNRPMTTTAQYPASSIYQTKLPSNPISIATSPIANVKTGQVFSQNLGYNRPAMNDSFPSSNFNEAPAFSSSGYGQMNAVSKPDQNSIPSNAPPLQSDSYLVNNQTINNVSSYSDPLQNSSSRTGVRDSPVLQHLSQTTAATSSAQLNSSLGHLNSSPTPPLAKDHLNSLRSHNDTRLPTSSSSSPVQQVLHQNSSQDSNPSSLYSTVQKMPGDGSSKAPGAVETHKQDDLFPVVGQQYNFHSSGMQNITKNIDTLDDAESSPSKIPGGEQWPQNSQSSVAGGDSVKGLLVSNNPEVKDVSQSNSHPPSMMQQAPAANPAVSQSNSAGRFTNPSAQNTQSKENSPPFSQVNVYRTPNPTASQFPPNQVDNHMSAIPGSQANVGPNPTQDAGTARYPPAVNINRPTPLGGATNFAPPTPAANFGPPTSAANVVPPTSAANVVPPSSTKFVPPTPAANFAPPPTSTASFAPPRSTANFAPPPSTSGPNFAPPPTSGPNFAPPPTSGPNVAPAPTTIANFAPPNSGSNFAPTSSANFAPQASAASFAPPRSSANFAPPPTSTTNFAPPTSTTNFAPTPIAGSNFTPPASSSNFAPPLNPGSNFSSPASTAGFAPPRPATNSFAPPTAANSFAPPTAANSFAPPTAANSFAPPTTAKFAPPVANYPLAPPTAAKFAPPVANYPVAPPTSNYMPAASVQQQAPHQQQFGPPPVMSQPRPNLPSFQNQFQNRYPPQASAAGMQQQLNQFAAPNNYGPPSTPYNQQQGTGPYRQPLAPQFQQARQPQPGMMDNLTNQFRGASVTQEGYNRLWGMDTLDLLKTRDLLSKDKTEAPTIRLNPEMFDAPNCSPELFRCTLAKIPESKSLLEKSRLPLGVLIHPFKDLNQLSVIQCTTIVRCRTCRTYINPFVFFVDNKRWKCNLCFRVNELPEEFQFDPLTKTYGDPSRRPEIRSATIEFIAPSEYMVRPPQPAIYLFLFDVSRLGAECGYLSVVCQTILDELDNLPGDARTSVGFIAYDSSVHFYSLAEGLNRPHQMTVVDIEDMFLPCPDNLIVNLSENIDLVRDLLTHLPTQYAESYDTESALGAALQAAYKLLAPTGGRVTVFQARLPSIGPGALASREDPSQRAGDSVPHLNPSTDFYKKLALDCSGQQVAVDLFFVNSQYVDIATLSGVSRFSGGCMHHFPLFRSVDLMHVKILKKCLRRYLSRKIGFESVMRLRCTRGLSVHTFHGNFFVRSTDLLSLPNVNPDAGFGMQVSIDENLAELQTVCFQAALLYTSSKGERRIRVHTLCLPIANSLSDVLNSADQLCIIGLLSKMAVDRSMESSISDAREAFVNVAADILSAYRLTQSSAPHGSLLAAYTLRLIPLYILALLKFVAFRIGQSTRLDDRVFAMCQIKSLPLAQLLQLVYPDMYPIHDLEKHPVREVGPEKEKVHEPPRLHLSAERLDSHGIYLLDNGQIMIVYVGHNCSATLCQALFGAPSFSTLPHESFDLPELDTAESDRLFAFIHHLCSEKAYVPCIQVIRDDSHHRMKFLEQLVEDKNEAGTSYYEFLQRIKQLGK